MGDLIGSHTLTEDTIMGEGINTDKVIVNAGGSGEGGAGNMAAVIAALGNRNQGNDNAALIAALGNRNDDSNSWGPMLAAMNNRGQGYGYDGGGFGGMNGILGIAALGLIFGRGGRGGLFGGGDGDGGGCGAETRLQSNADTLAILQQIGQAKDATTGGFANTALALSQGFANVRDSVQASTFLLNKELCDVNQNVSAQGCQTREAVQNDGDKTRALLIARFQQQDATTIAEQNARIVALETRSHSDRQHAEQVLSITNTNTAVAAQAQQQQQQQRQSEFESLRALLFGFNNNFNQTMLARQAQDIVNLGTMTASGTQAAANTQVR